VRLPADQVASVRAAFARYRERRQRLEADGSTFNNGGQASARKKSSTGRAFFRAGAGRDVIGPVR
jgi:hypothetical protein